MNDSRSRILPAVVGTLLWLLFQPAPSYAQLEEIVVTAERREALVQDVPLAVSAYSEELIDMLQIDEGFDLLNVVPNLFGGHNTGLGTANMYYLRAQGNDESIATFDPPVGVYVDGVYVTRQNANNFSFFDVQRIEVLRGPQGTLFGRNTTGGAINVVLKKPAESFGAFTEIGFGRFNEYLIRGTVDLPVSEVFLTKFSAYSIQNDGWLDNTVVPGDYNAKDSLGSRAAVRLLPAKSLTWDLSLSYIEDNTANVLGALVGDDRVSTSVLPAGLPARFEQNSDYGNYTESLNAISNLTWDTSAGTTNLILGYRALDQEYLINFPGAGTDDFLWVDSIGDHDMFSAELKWVGGLFDGRVELVSGLFYLNEDNTTDFASYLFGAMRLADRVLVNTTDSWAVYAQGDIAIGERGTLTLGARYTDETKNIGLSDNTGAGILTSDALADTGIPLQQDESVTTPRIAFAYDFSDDIMGYVSATRGFKSGGWNARGTAPAAFQPFGPEFIWSYEVGLRADWLDSRLRTNATLFYSDLKDLQTSAGVAGQFLTTNAGGLEVKGLELELTAVPTDIWTVYMSLGLQDAEYVSLSSDCTVPNLTLAAFDVNCNVATPKRAPEVTLTVATTLEWPITALGASLGPRVMARYIGENVVGTRGRGVNEHEVIVNAGLSLVDDDNRWSATIECKNCSDEDYITSYLFTPYFSPPMTWQASVRFNFGDR